MIYEAIVTVLRPRMWTSFGEVTIRPITVPHDYMLAFLKSACPHLKQCPHWTLLNYPVCVIFLIQSNTNALWLPLRHTWEMGIGSHKTKTIHQFYLIENNLKYYFSIQRKTEIMHSRMHSLMQNECYRQNIQFEGGLLSAEGHF